MATTENIDTPYGIRKYSEPPVIQGHQIDPRMPLHQLAANRIHKGRDLKVIITAEDSETGVGKTTAAGWLALSWTKLFAGHDWYVDPENPTDGMGTLNPKEYFQIIGKVGNEFDRGTVVVVDDAEELDARRSMQNLNVEFSQRWMLMRLKQAITILTLPSPAAIDSRLEELADIWINITRRGRGLVHDIRVNSYGNRKVKTHKEHLFEFPNVADHPQLENLRKMKEDKMDRWDDESEEEDVDPESIERDEKITVAQRMRDKGISPREIAEYVDRSHTWVYNNTEATAE